MNRWKCTVCGYTYSGEEAQENCPYCSGHCTVINTSTDCRENPEECQRPPE